MEMYGRNEAPEARKTTDCHGMNERSRNLQKRRQQA